MGMFEKLQLSDATVATIEWEITPDLAFCAFSAKGLRGGLAKGGERVCYFFIDNWGREPRLYLMERGSRYVNILAEVKAPPAMLAACLAGQGATPSSRGNFPIDAALKGWLLAEVVNSEDSPYLVPVIAEAAGEEEPGEPLPPLGKNGCNIDRVVLPGAPAVLHDNQLAPLIRHWNFYDAQLNPEGAFANGLADGGDQLTVVAERTGLMWQRGGLDLSSSSRMRKGIEQLNAEGFAGYHDWRLPTLEEAMSLLEAAVNAKGLHLHPCFSRAHSFVFTATRRKPTGYWFVDYLRGRAYWSSGTVPGGYGRLCRRMAG